MRRAVSALAHAFPTPRGALLSRSGINFHRFSLLLGPALAAQGGLARFATESRSPPPKSSPPPPSAPTGPTVVEVTSVNFDAEVNRSTTPVILDVYADWCEPCKQLTPALERFVHAVGGNVKLCKLNSDTEPEISQALQIKSLPTVFGISNGKLLDRFEGIPEQASLNAFFQTMMDAANVSSGPVSVALEQYAALREAIESADYVTAQSLVQSVLKILEKEMSEAATELKVKTMASLIRVLIGQKKDLQDVPIIVKTLRNTFGKYLGLDEVSQALAAADLLPKSDSAVGEMKPLLDAVAAAPSDPQPLYNLAQAYVSAGDPAAAVDPLLRIVAIDKHWNDAAGKTMLLKVLEALGPGHPMATTGRKKLAKLLFS